MGNFWGWLAIIVIFSAGVAMLYPLTLSQEEVLDELCGPVKEENENRE